MSGDVLLETREVVKDFGGLRAVDRVSFTLRRGELRCLIGPNGAGKSTFFKLLAGLLRPSAGTIRFKQADVTQLAPHEIARAGIGIKFQVPRVYDELPVAENFWLAAHFRRPGADTRLLVERLLDELALASRRHRPVKHLSHGERQWVEIGMVLAAEPELILLDEPTAGMTAAETRQTARLVREVNTRASVIVVEHDMSFVRDLSAMVTVLHRGTILAEGTMDEIRENASVRDIYLGKGRYARG